LAFFIKTQTSSTKDGASFVGSVSGKFSYGKLAGKNAKEGIFTRFPGLRCRSGPPLAVLLRNPSNRG